jgi:hypothetical protein
MILLQSFDNFISSAPVLCRQAVENPALFVPIRGRLGFPILGPLSYRQVADLLHGLVLRRHGLLLRHHYLLVGQARLFGQDHEKEADLLHGLVFFAMACSLATLSSLATPKNGGCCRLSYHSDCVRRIPNSGCIRRIPGFSRNLNSNFVRRILSSGFFSSFPAAATSGGFPAGLLSGDAASSSFYLPSKCSPSNSPTNKSISKAALASSVGR